MGSAGTAAALTLLLSYMRGPVTLCPAGHEYAERAESGDSRAFVVLLLLALACWFGFVFLLAFVYSLVVTTFFLNFDQFQLFISCRNYFSQPFAAFREGKKNLPTHHSPLLLAWAVWSGSTFFDRAKSSYTSGLVCV